MVKIVKNLVPESKYGIKCPYTMKPTRIVVHNTANDATARNEVSYMIKNNNKVSFHYAVDDKEVVQGIEENRNAFHATDGNGKGNREGIAIEICYSKSGGDRFIKAEQNAVDLIADILKRYGWSIDKVTKHQDYYTKYCPHRTLDMGWDRFINMVQEKLSPIELKDTDIYYQVYTNGRWLPNVLNTEDYAGLYGSPFSGLYANSSKNNKITYQVHTIENGWLPEVTDRSDYAGILGKTIDGVKMKSEIGDLYYRVHLLGGNWLPLVKNYDDYAGIYGQAIDGIECYIKEKTPEIKEQPVSEQHKEEAEAPNKPIEEPKEEIEVITPPKEEIIENQEENDITEDYYSKKEENNPLLWIIQVIVDFIRKIFKR